VTTVHDEYAERGREYGIIFVYRLFCEYIHPEYEGIRGIYRVKHAKYVIHILVVAPQEYVNIYSICRVTSVTSVRVTARLRLVLAEFPRTRVL